MAGGQRIDDHKSWVGSKPHGEVFPHGPHKTKMEHSAMSGGELTHYEDTTEKIREQQDMSVKKAKGHAQKPLHRY
jgi:hypothetical protein